jgi:23S rRNA (uracil1939-C5)-methyltransferase
MNRFKKKASVSRSLSANSTNSKQTSSLPFRHGDIFQLKVERLAVGGRGVGRREGVVIFIPDTIPGESVEIQIVEVKKNFAEAKLLRVLEVSSARRQPPCSVASVCGGCNWQHLDYQEQLRWKRELIIDSLRKFSGFEFENSLVEDVTPSPSEFRYRNRIQLHHENKKIGFFRRESHQIVDIDDCLIAEESIAREIPSLKDSLRDSPAGRLEVFISEQGEVRTRTDKTSFETDATMFSQVNSKQNQLLVNYVVSAVQQAQPTIVFDLYAGAGNFSFPLKKALPQSTVIAVELSRLSVESALRKMEEETSLNPHPIRFIQASVDDYLTTEPIPDHATVLLDPPRTGCGRAVMERISSATPQRVIYVSCHPVTLARDLRFLQNVGYEIISVRPFDMFPQTDHVETVVQLKLRDNRTAQSPVR